MEEKWVDIEGYEGLYEISNTRYIRRPLNAKGQGLVSGRVLKQVEGCVGYLVVGLYRDGKSKTKTVHRLLAKAFIPNPENKPFINHINGIKTDNRLENLEWCTNQENIIHGFSTGLIDKRKGRVGNTPKLTEKEVIEIVRLINNGYTVTSIANRFNLTKAAISAIKNGKNWTRITGLPNRRGKLSELQVVDIYSLIKEGLTSTIIAQKYNVSRDTIANIKSGRVWSNVTNIKKNK